MFADPDLSGIIAGLSMFLTGHLVMSLALAGPERRGTARARGSLEWCATSLLLGMSILTTILIAWIWVFGPLGVGAGRALLTGPAVGGLILLVRPGLAGGIEVRRRLGSGMPACEVRGVATKSGLEIFGFVLLGLAAVAVIFTAFSLPVHLFDPTFHFAYKGKILFTEGFGREAWTNLDGPLGRVMTHPTYPPGVPAMEVLASYPRGSFSATAGRGLMAMFALAPAVWIYAALRSTAFRSGSQGRAPAIIGALLWMCLPILFYLRLPFENTYYDAVRGLLVGPNAAPPVGENMEWRSPVGPSLDGGGDLPLAALIFGAIVHLWRRLPNTRAESDRSDVIFGGLLLGAAVLAKNEGLALLVCLLAAGGLALGARHLFAGSKLSLARIGPFFWATAIAIAMIIPWFVFKSSIPIIDESYPDLLVPSKLAETLFARRPSGELSIVIVGTEFLKTFLNPLHWSGIWVLFFGYVSLALIKPKRMLTSDAAMPALFVLGGLAAFFLILVVTPWALGQLFTTGIPDRLFLQLAPTAVLATMLIAWPQGSVQEDGSPDE